MDIMRLIFVLYLSIVVGIITVRANHWDNTTLVQITEGMVHGAIWTSLSGRDYVSFRGIPYAMPPVGRLRFKPPQPSKPWNGVWDATEEGAICPQYLLGTDIYAGDEDCLFVNVYTHSQGQRRPVVVWIHGGAFIAGDGGIEENGPEFLMDQDIVLVTFNYRLGFLGYASTGDKTLPGNYGNKDQVELLRWVQRNIGYFGGDSDKVTLFGYSAGAACAHSHQFSPLSTGLFHRVVFQSGSALNAWAFDENPLGVTRMVGELVNCSITTKDTLIACLMTKTAEELVKTLYSFPYGILRMPIPFKLVQEYQEDTNDPPFLIGHLYDLITRAPINDVPVITGTTSDESVLVALQLIKNYVKKEDIDETMRREMCLNISSWGLQRVREFYLTNDDINDAPLRELIPLFSDPQFTYGVYKAATIQASTSAAPIYFYHFSFQGRISEVMTLENYEKPFGVGHADDLAYLFRRKVPFPGGANSREMKTIKRVGKMLSNFAETGNPIPKTTELLTEFWKPINEHSDQFYYLDINDEISMRRGFFEDRIAFWDWLLEEEASRFQELDNPHTEL